MPMAGRLLPASWAATAVTAAKTQPTEAIPSARPSESTQGSPGTPRPTVTSSATPRLASNAVSSPDVSAASRPTAPAPTSSSRPASSSPLVCLTTMNMLITATATAPKTPSFQVASPPSVCTSAAGP